MDLIERAKAMPSYELERLHDIWNEGKRAYNDDVCPYTDDDEQQAWHYGRISYASDSNPFILS